MFLRWKRIIIICLGEKEDCFTSCCLGQKRKIWLLLSRAISARSPDRAGTQIWRPSVLTFRQITLAAFSKTISFSSQENTFNDWTKIIITLTILHFRISVCLFLLNSAIHWYSHFHLIITATLGRNVIIFLIQHELGKAIVS